MKRILLILLLISSLFLTSCKGNVPKDKVDNNGENTNIESSVDDKEEYKSNSGG